MSMIRNLDEQESARQQIRAGRVRINGVEKPVMTFEERMRRFNNEHPEVAERTATETEQLIP